MLTTPNALLILISIKFLLSRKFQQDQIINTMLSIERLKYVLKSLKQVWKLKQLKLKKIYH